MLDSTGRGGSASAGRGGRKLRLSPMRRASLKLQGRYMQHLRSLKKARAKALRTAKGVRAAIIVAGRMVRSRSSGARIR